MSRTTRPREVFVFLLEFFAANDQMPPLSEIQRHFGMKSRNSALLCLRQLEKERLLQRNSLGNLMFPRVRP